MKNPGYQGNRNSCTRLPFGRHDQNSAKSPIPNGNTEKKSAAVANSSDSKRTDVQRLVKQAFGLGHKAKGSASAFKIFEESEHLNGEHDVATHDIVEKTKSLALSGQKDRNCLLPSNSKLASAQTPAINDYDIMRKMVNCLDTVLDIGSCQQSVHRQQTPEAEAIVGVAAPSKWVQRYVDYTSKYGLGFLLNDGTSGVCFNDSTKTSLDRDGESFHYIERKRVESSEAGRSDYEVSCYLLSDFPESLNKKVTLLKHFRNYLIEQQKKAKDDLSIEAVYSKDCPSEFIYIKKWTRTKHAILFRLSNHTVQIIFYDQTEVLLTPDDQLITYVDKTRVRKTYLLTDQLVVTFPELEKRIKYSRDIIHQLISTQR